MIYNTTGVKKSNCKSLHFVRSYIWRTISWPQISSKLVEKQMHTNQGWSGYSEHPMNYGVFLRGVVVGCWQNWENAAVMAGHEVVAYMIRCWVQAWIRWDGGSALHSFSKIRHKWSPKLQKNQFYSCMIIETRLVGIHLVVIKTAKRFTVTGKLGEWQSHKMENDSDLII